MRVVRVRYENSVFYAWLSGDELVCLNKELGFTDPIPLNQVLVLPAVLPSKVVCMGLNYRSHAEEMGKPLPDEPLIFFKPPSAVIGPGQTILLPPQSEQVDFEGELALVIGKTCRNAAVENIPEHVFGFTCANDVTARDLQRKDGLYARAKGFDTFLPVGPWIETEVADLPALTLTTTVNGQIRQQAPVSDMIFSPFEVISFISRIMTLLPGDVVLTGTPAGIGPLHPGDEVRVEIPGVGVLINPVGRTTDESPEPVLPMQ